MYEKLEKLLKQREITAYRLSKDIGLPTSLFSEWKKGKSNPKVDKLQKIAKYFNVPIEYFLENENEKREKHS